MLARRAGQPKWRTLYVIVIPKPGRNLNHPQNYHPISLLSCIGKLLERLILTRLQTWLESSSLIPNEQHGFRAHHSTCHQILRVTEYCTLMQPKLLQADAPAWITHITHSFLESRTFRIKIGTTFSSCKLITAGVPQGSVLSPSLYNIYTHDIPKTANTLLSQ